MHFTPRHLADLRAEFAKGGLEASLLAAQLLEMVEKLQSQLRAAEAAAATAPRAIADQEAAALERSLEESAAAGTACAACGDAAARAVAVRLRHLAKGDREARRNGFS
jgi:acyl transferase domain-containing protein